MLNDPFSQKGYVHFLKGLLQEYTQVSKTRVWVSLQNIKIIDVKITQNILYKKLSLGAMADSALQGPVAQGFCRYRIKPEIYKTVYGKVMEGMWRISCLTSLP